MEGQYLAGRQVACAVVSIAELSTAGGVSVILLNQRPAISPLQLAPCRLHVSKLRSNLRNLLHRLPAWGRGGTAGGALPLLLLGACWVLHPWVLHPRWPPCLPACLHACVPCPLHCHPCILSTALPCSALPSPSSTGGTGPGCDDAHGGVWHSRAHRPDGRCCVHCHPYWLPPGRLCRGEGRPQLEGVTGGKLLSWTGCSEGRVRRRPAAGRGGKRVLLWRHARDGKHLLLV